MESQNRNENNTHRPYNFLINTSNQANLANVSNLSQMQLNSVFILIEPFRLEKIHFEALNVHLDISEEGTITINNMNIQPIEIKPGIYIFGIIKRNQQE